MTKRDTALQGLSTDIQTLVRESLNRLSRKQRGTLNVTSWFTTMRRDRAAFRSVIVFEDLLAKLKVLDKRATILTNQEIAVIECIHYLTYCEGPLQTITGQLCLYAVAAGRSFRVIHGGKSIDIRTPDDILKTNLDEKRDFLVECGVRFPPDVYNGPLRNAIAHMDFNIEADGTIVYGRRRMTYQRMEKDAWYTREVCKTMLQAMGKVTGDFLARDLKVWIALTRPLPSTK